MKIVGLGGTYRAGSSTERVLKLALDALAPEQTVLLGAEALDLPIYRPDAAHRDAKSQKLIDELRGADGIIIATPAYHAGISGMVKNALDYIEDLRDDTRPYLDGRAVGLIVTGGGWQASAATLQALRAVVHALRGWPTPLGVVVNTSEVKLDGTTEPAAARITVQLEMMAQQVAEFARRWKVSA